MLRQLAQLYLRLTMGIGFFVLGLDRLGAWGPNGSPGVSWGDWKHFSPYAHHLMSYLPYNLAEAFAMIATFVEVTGGFLLVIGLFTKQASFACSGLTLCFAIAMSIADGITSPMDYSVFTVSAAGLLLASLGEYRYSLDNLIAKKRVTLSHG
jgi:uncharacterized membrane protein YphA (DoxX/SURF4 family)